MNDARLLLVVATRKQWAWTGCVWLLPLSYAWLAEAKPKGNGVSKYIPAPFLVGLKAGRRGTGKVAGAQGGTERAADLPSVNIGL